MAVPLLVGNLTNIRYLSGLSMTAGVILLTQKQKILFTDDRYLEKAKEEAKRGIRVRHIEELPKYMKKYRRVRVEADDLTITRLKRWKKKFRGTKLVPSEGIIEEMRRRKKPAELKALMKACRITDKILAMIPKRLVRACRSVARNAPTHLTERALAWEIEKLAHDFGVDEMAFETIVAFGPHTSRPRHRPTKRKLKKGDLVQIDMGVKVDGYCSDCSRVFFTGKPTKEQREVFDLLLCTVKETTKMAKIGSLNTALDTYAREKLKKEGYGDLFLHSLGHGIGLEVHESINISSRAQRKRLLAQEVVTTEPGIYFAGKWGMRIEDTIVVGRSGGRRLTKAIYR